MPITSPKGTPPENLTGTCDVCGQPWPERDRHGRKKVGPVFVGIGGPETWHVRCVPEYVWVGIFGPRLATRASGKGLG